MPCHHFLHSNCLIRILFEGDINHCGTCNAIINPYFNDHYDTQTQLNESEQVKQLYENNPVFRKKAKELAKEQRLTFQKMSKASMFGREKRKEITPQMKLLKQQMKALIEMKKNEVTTSQVFKDYQLQLRKYHKLLNSFNQEYDFSRLALRRALRQERGFKTFRAYNSLYYQPYRFFRRIFSFGIRF